MTLLHHHASRGRSISIVHELMDAAQSLVGSLWSWEQHLSRRQHLDALDDHLLRDMGLTRLDVESEAEKPFWRA